MNNIVSLISSSLSAMDYSKRNGMADTVEMHRERIVEIVSEHLPSGSGFDSGTEILFDESTADKITFQTAFHHMDEMGGYDGWTHHRVIVTPSFITGANIRVTGRDRNGIKEYIGEAFYSALTNPLDASITIP